MKVRSKISSHKKKKFSLTVWLWTSSKLPKNLYSLTRRANIRLPATGKSSSVICANDTVRKDLTLVTKRCVNIASKKLLTLLSKMSIS